ncbi:ABC transporter substrate-binding protein [Agarivorans sp. OAG1]|uniref:Lysine-arginine-ornithine-binding periplasmic protein n=1 Tax=Agarivorans albus MKT 106 TaxID=1331007 RepID=R9PRN9_AGAAL|nr:transporter substrate-binding domain-containing protein [Agarivorans albus]BEU04099.1 ABC transporter substrate-binding protein [Agarivorans sp. OAG1]GAD03938.1 lysine-arginine-ornithine-binding periplasmic protein precursor [Agarivorans albus MKT 106]
MKKTLVAMIGAIALSTTAVEAKDWEVVRLAVDVPYEPFEYKAPDGSLTGFEIDLGNAVCEEMKVKCEWVIQAWDGIIPGLLARKYDAIFSSMSINEDRAKKVLFSEPYYNTPTGFFGPKASEVDPAKPETLKGLRVGVQRGTIQDTYATDNYSKVADIKRYTTGDDLVVDLHGGRLDVVVIDFPVGVSTIIEVEKGADFKVLGDNVQLGEGVGVAARKRDGELIEMFNKALATVKTNGVYDKINEKYFDYSIKK